MLRNWRLKRLGEREAIVYCESVRDYVTHELPADILASEEEHID